MDPEWLYERRGYNFVEKRLSCLMEFSVHLKDMTLRYHGT